MAVEMDTGFLPASWKTNYPNLLSVKSINHSLTLDTYLEAVGSLPYPRKLTKLTSSLIPVCAGGQCCCSEQPTLMKVETIHCQCILASHWWKLLHYLRLIGSHKYTGGIPRLSLVRHKSYSTLIGSPALLSSYIPTIFFTNIEVFFSNNLLETNIKVKKHLKNDEEEVEIEKVSQRNVHSQSCCLLLRW